LYYSESIGDEKEKCSMSVAQIDIGGVAANQLDPGGISKSQVDPGGISKSQVEPWELVTIGGRA
jgi:hypothetical protein